MWTKFNDIGTPVWKFLFMQRAVIEEYTRQVIQTGLKKGIYYQEWRTMFLSPKPIIDAQGVAQGHEYYLEVMDNVIEEEKKKSGGTFLGAKIIYCVSRQFPANGPSFLTVESQVKNLIALRKNPKWRKLIAGKNSKRYIYFRANKFACRI
jgi:hypothetical protein